MGIQAATIRVLIYLIMISICLSSCRRIPGETDEERRQSFHAESFFQSSWHFPATESSPEKSGRDKNDPIYGVRHQTVPNGPNPLHN
ncbi:hypothetical protein Nepgr_028438 [Nepenthes gracilis]|uniref:Uncharacterized protein n=1 Tax=Nepenthes gracilis TaxID=150966 RepID=A0AAD3Y3Y6_NEPGR|nr:hypothetical protein Nepgr_028438 [Nepenthes gracilis]